MAKRTATTAKLIKESMVMTIVCPVNLEMMARSTLSAETAAANNMVNLIPHCIVMGQAAGTAQPLSLDRGVSVRQVDYRELQESLAGQGVPLPQGAPVQS